MTQPNDIGPEISIAETTLNVITRPQRIILASWRLMTIIRNIVYFLPQPYMHASENTNTNISKD